MCPARATTSGLEAYGSGGALLFDTSDPNGLVIVEGANAPIGGRRLATLSRTVPAAALPSPETPTGVVQWHLASIAAFLDALGRGIPPQPSLHDGLAVDRVIAAAFASAARDGAPIAV